MGSIPVALTNEIKDFNENSNIKTSQVHFQDNVSDNIGAISVSKHKSGSPAGPRPPLRQAEIGN